MNENFHHALKIIPDKCIGCTLCMKACPTQAIRVRNGLAMLIGSRCIDCGECFRVCPVSAISIEQDDFSDIFNYKYRVVLLSSVLLGQFPEKIRTMQIYGALHELGFTHVFHLEQGAEILKKDYRKKLKKIKDKPVITSFCPAVVRLIQVRFPALVNHLLLLKPPLDISAIYIRHLLELDGVDPEEIGVFHITPCAAKIAAIKSPAENEKSPITGVINLDSIYSLIYQKISVSGIKTVPETDDTRLSQAGLLWSLTRGEAAHAGGKRLAIDGIHNVTAFLEKFEEGRTDHFDFLELRACDESCAGGVLAPVNRFLTVDRLQKKSESQKKEERRHHLHHPSKILDHYEFLSSRIELPKIQPRSILKLDNNMLEAMKKMNTIRDLMKILPQVDCGMCGSPGCRTMAEDIAQGYSQPDHCIFLQKKYEKNGSMTQDETHEILSSIWGKGKIEGNYENQD